MHGPRAPGVEVERTKRENRHRNRRSLTNMKVGRRVKESVRKILRALDRKWGGDPTACLEMEMYVGVC